MRDHSLGWCGRRTLGRAGMGMLLGLAAGTAWAGPYDPPPGYYDSATGVGATLRNNLHALISLNWHTQTAPHNFQPYENAPKALAIVHRRFQDQVDDDQQILLYNAEVETQVWSNGVGWNREHTWPRSRGISTTGHDNSDLHMLRPCDSSVNSSRGNLPFGTGGGEWDPNNLGGEDRGEIARCMFYADVRYDGNEPETTNLQLVVGSPGGSQMGDLSELLAWHYDEPVDDRERFRNQLIYSDNGFDWEDAQLNVEITIPGFERPPIAFFQGNRNPFIDRPEFVWAIFGVPLHGDNNSTLHVGVSPNGDGSSSDTVQVGRVIAGTDAVLPPIQVTKLGSHPTTYDLVATGGVVALNPQGNAVPFSPQTFDLEGIGLVPQGSPGSFGGTLTIDNTDLTSGGAGQGSADGDDVLTINALAVDHSNASFQPGVDQNTLVVNLGSVPQGTSQPVTIHALVATPGLTAALDLDGANGSGDTAELGFSFFPVGTLPAGGSAQFNAFVEIGAAPGSYQAQYVVSSSDEDIPGATAGADLTLTITATVVPGSACTGDVDGDGDTDVFDFADLSANFGAGPGATRAMGDLTGDGFVDVFDFGELTADFGCQP